MDFALLIPIMGILVALIPATGLTVVLVLRLGGKPFVEALAKEMRASGIVGSAPSDARIEDLSEQIAILTAEMHRMQEAQSFDRKLMAAAKPDAADPS